MSEVNGHVKAPVGLYEVVRLLGESSLDVGTVCTSPNINPYSLIQPAPASYPGFGVEHMEDGWETADNPGDSSNFYEGLKWGFLVPYVGQPADILKIMNKAWVRHGAKGFYCLNHFDGYLHNVRPSLPILSYTIETGRPIAVSFVIGGIPSEVVNLVDGVAKGNPGSVVTIGHVFKDKSVWAGFSLYKNNIDDPNNLIHPYISASEVDFNSSQVPVTTVVTDFNAESETDYYIVPWISDGQIGEANAKFYSLKYAPDYEPYIHVRTDFAGVYISGISITENQLGYYDFSVTISNTLPTAQNVTNGRLIASSTEGITVRNQNPGVIAGTIPSQSSQTFTGRFELSATPIAQCSVYLRVEWTGGQQTPTDPIPHLTSQYVPLNGSGIGGPEKPREE